MKKSYEMDMCSGPLLSKILIFAIPLMLSGILQLLFNAADMIVVGRFSGSNALAAVGSTGALNNLNVNIFMGLSVGTNVVVAKNYGAKNFEKVSNTVHTAILAGLSAGSFLVFVGIFLARPALEFMATPVDVIDQSILYMRIYFAGMPALMVYNFGSAALRAVGDTKRPLYFMMAAGVINVILNLIFVIVFHMGVAGVALATVISETVSAALVVFCLMKNSGPCHLNLKKLRFHKEELLQMLRIGLPAGVQGMIFSLSNVLIQSSVNSFGSSAMAGHTAASNIEGFVYMTMNAIYQTSLSFTSQNVGAKQFKRVDRVFLECQAVVIVVGFLMGNAFYLMGDKLLGIYTSDPEIIQYGLRRMSVVCALHFIGGMMDVIVGSIRGLGYSIMPMLVSLTGVCLFRVIWIFTVFRMHHTLLCLYSSYPISWTLTFTIHLICYLIVRRKVFARTAKPELHTA